MSIILANFGKYAISDCPFIGMFLIPNAYEIITMKTTDNNFFFQMMLISMFLIPNAYETITMKTTDNKRKFEAMRFPSYQERLVHLFVSWMTWMTDILHGYSPVWSLMAPYN